MRITPQIHRCSRAILPEELQVLPRQRFETDWNGEPLAFRVEFALAVEPGFLHFLATTDLPTAFLESREGEFIEGLWEQDVAELFIRDADSTNYQEWNVSPSGAWWSQTLSAERVRTPDFSPDRATSVKRIVQPKGWGIILQIPHHEAIWQNVRMNVTLILTDENGSRRYLSCCPDPDKSPDFHTIKSYPTPTVLNFS